MPGISFSNIIKKKNSVLTSTKSLLHNEDYKSEVLLTNEHYFVLCTRYPQYPIEVFEDDDLWICLEGKIYGVERSTIHAQLDELLLSLFKDGITDKITNWLLKTDGDFVIYAFNKTNQNFIVLNDALGRLPTYYFRDSNEVIISRELQFILNLIENPALDRMAIAQYLIFCYPLGKKTLIENVYRLEPATVVRIFGNRTECKIENIYRFNFEQKSAFADTSRIAENLSVLFSEACKTRSELGNKNILALSGGRDSRSVAASLYKNRIPFIATTFIDPDRKYESDLEIANKLASKLNIQWENYRLRNPTGKDVDKLLSIKNGLNYLAMSFILSFFDELGKKHGSHLTIFTGDGGDKVLPNLNPNERFNDTNELANYIISRNYIFSLSEAAAITRISENQIIKEIEKNISSYPETDLNQKYVHFMIYERAFKWLFEGEDRNRVYFWTVSPFYSVPFFDYAMKCSDNLKLHDLIYQQFILKLSSEAIVSLDYAGRPQANKSKFYKDIYDLKILLLRNLKGSFLFPIYIKLLNLSYNKNSNLIRCLQEQINCCKEIDRFLSTIYLSKIAKRSSYHYKIKLDNLFTLTSFIEKTNCNTNTIMNYNNKYF